jgi:DNA (cytosine-5)-methyltransferase 1
MIDIPLKTGPWKLAELKSWPKHGKKVFSCFHCGGGSTMGYKLAGYEVLGGVEIDPEMMAIYRVNHNPKYSYLMGVQEFKNIPNEELPKELFELDILDGSPPCSSFSMAGSREKAWGKEKKFREGQAVQVLDDLFFDFIDVAKKLQPKVVVAENVKGLVQGNARGYVKQIFQRLQEVGYSCQLFLLNASRMGVPQKRERTFFVANKMKKKITLDFSERTIAPRDISFDIKTVGKNLSTKAQADFWTKTKPGEGLGSAGGFNSQKKIRHDEPVLTQTASTRHWHWAIPAQISDELVIRLQSFPDDYKFGKQDVAYFCGMSVPPFMMQRVALEIYKQWLAD